MGGAQKTIEIEEELKVRHFYDLRISQEVSGDPLGEEFAGYVFKIMGGMDKQGFPMIQGVLLPHRTRLLLRPGAKGYRPRRKGMMKRKSVRGCIVAQDLSVLNLVIVERGPAELPGITDVVRPRRLGPKRASKIRKLFDLDETDDVRKFVVRRPLPGAQDPAPRHPPAHPAQEARPQGQEAAHREQDQAGLGLRRAPCRPRRPEEGRACRPARKEEEARINPRPSEKK